MFGLPIIPNPSTPNPSVIDVTAAVQALLPNPPTSLNIPAVGNAALGGVDPAPGKVKELKARSCVSRVTWRGFGFETKNLVPVPRKPALFF